MKEYHLNDKVQNAFFEFLNAKFKRNEIDFKQFVDVYKSIKHRNSSYLDVLLENKELFEELIENNLLNKEDLRYLLNRLDKNYEVSSLSENTSLLKYIIDKNIASFKEIADEFKNFKELDSLLKNKELFEKLIQNNRVNQEDLKYLLNEIDKMYEVDKLNENTILLKYIVDNDLFKELIDKVKSASGLGGLLENRKLFEKLIQNNKLSKDDLRYLLNTIDKIYELWRLCYNIPLTKYLLNEFVLNKEDADRLNRIAEKDEECKRENIHTLFDLIERKYKNNKEVLNLNELNKKVYLLNSFDLNEEQKLELIELLKDNEIARNRLIQIIDSHIESKYDFDSLMNCLKKVEKKTLLNI